MNLVFSLIKEESERQYLPELEPYCAKIKLFKRTSKPFTLGNMFRTMFSSYPFLVIRNYVPETIKAIEDSDVCLLMIGRRSILFTLYDL